jgi:putative addiction module component (TIGR02574 family)
MNTLLDEIQTKARQLSPEERADLALQLIQSLDAEKAASVQDWQAAWLAECTRRLQRFEAGEDPGVPLEDVLNSARSRLR